MHKAKVRGNGQGCAYKSGKSWEAQVVIGYRAPSNPSKQPIPIKRKKRGFQTKAAALAYCPILLAGGREPVTKAPRLFEYWETYKKGEYANLSKSKQTAYTIAWNRLKSLHDLRVDTITVEMLRTAVSSNCQTYYPARDCRSLLSNLFSLAGADRFADKDLPSFIVLPPLEEKEQTPFSVDEQAAIWKLYESGDRRAAIPLLMIYTGMMPGEAQALKVENIDLEAKVIVNAGLKTKVRKATPIVLADCLLPVMEDLIANARPNGYIWKRHSTEWYDAYYAALEAAGCRRLPPYSCRHTTATALAITEGIAPQTIRRVMRWSTTRMLDRYAHPQTGDALTAVNTIKKVSKPESNASVETI